MVNNLSLLFNEEKEMLHKTGTHLSILTQEYAKELFESQAGNIIYNDILWKRKAPQDLICMGSVLGKLQTLCYFRDEK